MTYCLLGKEINIHKGARALQLGDFGCLKKGETPAMVAVVAGEQGWDMVFVFSEPVSLQEAQQWLQAGKALSTHPKAKTLIVVDP